MTRGIDTWGIVALACGGKVDGSGYGGSVHDTHGGECCSEILIAKSIEPAPVVVEPVVVETITSCPIGGVQGCSDGYFCDASGDCQNCSFTDYTSDSDDWKLVAYNGGDPDVPAGYSAVTPA